MELLTIIAISAAYFAAGFVDSIAGGGGLIGMPALLLAGVPPHIALATNKFSATFGTFVATWNYARNKRIIWKIAAYGIPPALLGAWLGSEAILFISEDLAGKIIVALLPFAAVATFLSKNKKRGESQDLSKADLWFWVPLITFIIGFYDGLFGPGTGSLLIISFGFFLSMNLVKASATAKVFNLVSNIGALVVFLFAGKVWFLVGVPAAVANIAGNFLGSHLAIKKGDAFIKVILVAVITTLFASLVWKYFVQ